MKLRPQISQLKSNVLIKFQILSEEKSRIDAMAEGLEEESKKSLRSEAELEKHLQHCEKEKIALRAKMSSDEQR